MKKNDENKKRICTLTDEEIHERNRGYDHPDALTNFEATILYLIVMFGGSIFNDRILIWITATIIWFNHITRHCR